MVNEEDANELNKLLIRCLESRANKDEYDRVWQWSLQSSSNKLHYREMVDVKIASDLLKPVDSEIQKRVWLKIEKRIQASVNSKRKRITIRIKWISVAALFAVVYIIGTLFFDNHSENGPQVVTTAKDEKTMVELSDGTKIWLNSETSIIYPEKFGNNTRKIELTGEAFFEVAHRANKPFKVKTGDLYIEVLGTQFNVRAFQDEPSVSTTLVEGVVKVMQNNIKGKKKETLLTQGQQLQFDKQTGAMFLHEVDHRLFTVWKEGRISFEQEQIKNIFIFMEQYFHTPIYLENTQIAERKYTGRFNLNEKPETILRLIQQSIPFYLLIKNDTIYIK